MRSQPPSQRRAPALPRSSGNAPAKYLFTPGAGYSGYVRAVMRHNNWEGARLVDNVCDRRADLPTFIFDNYDASNRSRTIGISEQGSF